MIKVRPHPLLPYLVIVAAAAIGLVAVLAEAVRIEALVPWWIGAAGAVCVLLPGASHRNKINLVVAALATLSLTALSGKEVAILILAAESLLALSLEDGKPFVRMYFVLATSVFIFLALQSSELSPWIAAAYLCLRLLIVPSAARNAIDGGVYSIFFGALPALAVAYVFKFAVPEEAGLALGICAIVNVIFGRHIAALICANLAIFAGEPRLFIFAGAIVALSVGGAWEFRLATALSAALSVALLLFQNSPLHVAAAAASGIAAGLCWWAESVNKIKWPTLAASAISIAAAIYLNQDWLTTFELVSAPEQLAGVAAYGAALALGIWLRKYLPAKFKLRPLWRPTLRWPSIKINLPEPKLDFVKAVSGLQDFVTVLFLAAAALAVWFVRLAA